jgi:hypothetical protein
MEKSKSALLLGGGDFKGVMDPATPCVMDGMTFGKPISNWNDGMTASQIGEVDAKRMLGRSLSSSPHLVL